MIVTAVTVRDGGYLCSWSRSRRYHRLVVFLIPAAATWLDDRPLLLPLLLLPVDRRRRRRWRRRRRRRRRHNDVDVDDSATRSQRLATRRRRRFLKRVTRIAGDSVSRRQSVRKCETFASVCVCVCGRLCVRGRVFLDRTCMRGFLYVETQQIQEKSAERNQKGKAGTR